MYLPKFSISQKILKNISLIEACREVIQNAPLVPAWEAKFREEAIIRTVHHGTHIEGNELNFSQAVRVLDGQKVVAKERDIQEVINYRDVLKYLEKIKTKNRVLMVEEKIIKQLHKLTTEKILPPGKCGVYRKSEVVVRNFQTGEVTFAPPKALAVPGQMAEFLTFLKSFPAEEIHPVLLAGIAHYELVRVHPFLDGNGRVARALALLLLYQRGYEVKKFFSLEEYYDRDASQYYQALQSVEKNAKDLTFWLEYFCEGLAIELAKVKEKVQKLSRDLTLKKRLGGKQLSLSERQIKILEYLQAVGFLQNKAFPELFPMVSEDTVLRELQDLCQKGIIKKKGVTKAARYFLA